MRKIVSEHVPTNPHEIRVDERMEWVQRTLHENRFIPAMNICSGDSMIVRLDYGGGIGQIYDCLIRKSYFYQEGAGHGQSPAQAEDAMRQLNEFWKKISP